jgi:NADH-quinone oxidoreductase subunit E
LGAGCVRKRKVEGRVMNTATMDAVEQILRMRDGSSEELIEILHDMQQTCNYLPEEGLVLVSERLKVPLIEVFRVANFYKAFKLKPQGRHLLTVCLGTACHVRGADKLVDEVSGQLGIRPGETTADGEITLETVNCLGVCALGPVAILDGKYYERVTYAKLRAVINRLGKGKK